MSMIEYTLYGMYKYKPDLFDDIMLPAGVERELVVGEIMEHSGDLFPYYQASPERLKSNISDWFKQRLGDFERIHRALTVDYSPIENYDRYEDNVETPNIKRDTSGNSNGHTGGNSSSTTESKRSAFDSDEYSPDYVNGTTGEDSSHNDSFYESHDTETGERRYSSHVHGNIGVMTAMSAIREELALRKGNNIYEIIAHEFERKFLVQLY